MISVKVVVDCSECLRRLIVEGHAMKDSVSKNYSQNRFYPRNNKKVTSEHNLVCAAISCLARSAGIAIMEETELLCSVEASELGRFELSIEKISENKRGWLLGITDLLLKGINRIVIDNPNQVILVKDKVVILNEG